MTTGTGRSPLSIPFPSRTSVHSRHSNRNWCKQTHGEKKKSTTLFHPHYNHRHHQKVLQDNHQHQGDDAWRGKLRDRKRWARWKAQDSPMPERRENKTFLLWWEMGCWRWKKKTQLHSVPLCSNNDPGTKSNVKHQFCTNNLFRIIFGPSTELDTLNPRDNAAAQSQSVGRSRGVKMSFDLFPIDRYINVIKIQSFGKVCQSFFFSFEFQSWFFECLWGRFGQNVYIYLD